MPDITTDKQSPPPNMSETQQTEQDRQSRSPSRSQSAERSDREDTPADKKSPEPTKDSKDGAGMERTQSDRSSSAEEGEVPSNPPLPEGPPPDNDRDGWEAIWDPTHNAYYFYNEFTGETTWTNPRVPEASQGPTAVAPGTEQQYDDGSQYSQEEYNAYLAAGGAPTEEQNYSGLTYYQLQHGITDPSKVTAEDIANSYAQSARFNRFTGKWQMDKKAEDFSDEAKAKRQMSFYFDVDAAANSHDGRSLRAERQQKKLTKKEVKAFKEKRRERKEQKRKAWLKD